MSVLEETNFLLKKYNIRANKNLGQNFLINEDVVDKIINSAKIEKDDLIIEIGPGLGTLTSKLLEYAGKVIAVELDERMVKILEERFKFYHNFELINNDILKINLNELILNELNKFKKVKVVANLPYYITTPIIMKLLEDRLNIESITVMVQKEVAERITAKPGDKLSGAITYSVNYYAETKKITLVNRDSFIPSPEVDSEVIQLQIRKVPPVQIENKEMFFKLIKVSFMQRRKTLLNSITNSGLFKSKDKLKNIFAEMNLTDNVRGETLSMEQFAELSNLIIKYI